MAETLTELVAKIETDATGLKRGLSEGEKATEASSKRMADSLKKVGAAMAASGAAIIAIMGLMGKAAIDEDINIKRLAGTLGTVGVSYDKVKDSLEANIAATQRKTGIADDEQRDMLSRLILITQDYDAALKLMPIALNLAADAQMDTTTAATYLSKAYLDLENGAEKVSVRFGMAAVEFKNMEDIEARVVGKAEELANPLKVLTASIGDVAEAIGMNLIPLIKGAVDKIVDITIKIQDWVKEHPKLAKVLTLVALGLGVVLALVGGFLLILPGLITGVIAFGVVLHAALGPIGLVSLAIAGIIIVITAVIANWDKLTSIFRSDAEKQKRALEDLTEKVNAEFDKQTSVIKANYDKQRRESKKAYDAAVDAINKEYGIGEAAKEVSETKIEAAKRATEELKEQYQREQDVARDRYDSEMESVKALYSEKLATLNIETNATVKALQDQIDAIDQQTSEEELILQRKEEAKKLATLKGKELEEFTSEVARRELLRTRNAEKVSLRDQIAEARERAESRREQIRIEEDDALTSLKIKYDAEIKNYKDLAIVADTDLASELTRIETDRIAKITAEQEKLGATLLRLDTAEKAEVEALAKQLAATKQHVQDINEAYNALIKRYDIEIITHERTVQEGGGTSGTSGGGGGATISLAHGGIVPGAIGAPQLAVVHGGETVIPANEGIGTTVNVTFTQPVFFDREDTMNRFVDMIRKGIQRQDRLRFGGAYSG